MNTMQPSIRDLFAAVALPQCLEGMNEAPDGTPMEQMNKAAAKLAFEIADCMMVARQVEDGDEIKTVLRRICQKIDSAENQARAEVNAECISGNVVKHSFAKGMAAGLRAATAIIEELL